MSDARPPKVRGAMPLLWCLAAAALFGASTPASKPLVSQLGPWLLSGLLYLGAALVVASPALDRRRSVGRADRSNRLRLAGAVLFGGIVGPVLLMVGLRLASAGSVALWLNLETAATAVLARLFFREHLHARTWAAVLLIMLASVLLSPTTPGGGTAALLIAGASIAWGFDNNLTAMIDAFSASQITFAKGVIAGTVNSAIGLWRGGLPASAAQLGAGLGIGGVGYGASLLLYIAGAQNLGATRSQLLFSTAPGWGLVLAWVALGEPIEPMQLVAGLIMALAVWLWYRERHAHEHCHPRLRHNHWHCHDDGHHDHEHEVEPQSWHAHPHEHQPVTHTHSHRPDLHHRHPH